MRIRTALLATVALAATIAIAAPASAAGPVITLSSFGDPDTLAPNQTLIADFNNTAIPNAVIDPTMFSLTLSGATVGVNEGGSGYSGTLYGDPTHYLTIPGNASATLTSVTPLKYLSFYMGSPDSYNAVRFTGLNGYDVTIPGSVLVAGDTNQSWSWGKRVNFDFGSSVVTGVTFSSSQNSFELDNIAGGVPEASTWALMIVGFGGAGAMLRRRRTAAAFA